MIDESGVPFYGETAMAILMRLWTLWHSTPRSPRRCPTYASIIHPVKTEGVTASIGDSLLSPAGGGAPPYVDCPGWIDDVDITRFSEYSSHPPKLSLSSGPLPALQIFGQRAVLPAWRVCKGTGDCSWAGRWNWLNRVRCPGHQFCLYICLRRREDQQSSCRGESICSKLIIRIA